MTLIRGSGMCAHLRCYSERSLPARHGGRAARKQESALLFVAEITLDVRREAS